MYLLQEQPGYALRALLHYIDARSSKAADPFRITLIGHQVPAA